MDESAKKSYVWSRSDSLSALRSHNDGPRIDTGAQGQDAHVELGVDMLAALYDSERSGKNHLVFLFSWETAIEFTLQLKIRRCSANFLVSFT